ncbi:MAG: hypothetical protein ACI4JK_00955 [Oscillospiraceae bacterium]
MKRTSYWDESLDKYWDKAHAKNPNDYESARIIIYAPDESNLHEITLTCIKTLNYNGAWDFAVEHIDKENLNIITFKYNGTITAADAISKLNFHCKYTIKSEWE